MPSKSRTVKGSRKRLFIKRPVFIDCNRCSHREESLHVISCLSSHSDVQTFLPRLSLSRRPSHCRAGSISSHRHVTQRETQTGEEDRRRVKRHWTKSDNVRERRTRTETRQQRLREEDERRTKTRGLKHRAGQRRAHLKAVDSSNVQTNFSHVEWNLEYSELNIQFVEKTDSN